MLGHGAGIGYTGPGPRMGPTDNFSLGLVSSVSKKTETLDFYHKFGKYGLI